MHVISYGLVKLLIILFQVDTPEASVQVPRAAHDLRFLGIANCYRGILESNDVAFNELHLG
jgi:hypothetical protein